MGETEQPVDLDGAGPANNRPLVTDVVVGAEQHLPLFGRQLVYLRPQFCSGTAAHERFERISRRRQEHLAPSINGSLTLRNTRAIPPNRCGGDYPEVIDK